MTANEIEPITDLFDAVCDRITAVLIGGDLDDDSRAELARLVRAIKPLTADVA